MNAVRLITGLVFAIVMLPVHAKESIGRNVFLEHCESCHSDREDRPGTRSLRRSRGEAYALLESRSDLTPVYIRTIVRNGFKAMPNFRHLDLTDAELEALFAYLTE